MNENDEDVVHAGIVSNLKKPLNSGRFCNSPPTGSNISFPATAAARTVSGRRASRYGSGNSLVLSHCTEQQERFIRGTAPVSASQRKAPLHHRSGRKRARGAGADFVLACDVRFAASESAIFGQREPAFGLIPGVGGIQHLGPLMSLGRALEVMLSAEDYRVELGER
jgi:hypothetical protein